MIYSERISTLDWQKQQQSFDDWTTCGDPARLVSRLNWIYTPPLSSLQPYTPVRPGRVQLKYVSSWKSSISGIYGRFWHYVEGSHDEYGGAKPDWAAKITGHCGRETTSDGRLYYQDATWTTSQSCHVMDPSW